MLHAKHSYPYGIKLKRNSIKVIKNASIKSSFKTKIIKKKGANEKEINPLFDCTIISREN